MLNNFRAVCGIRKKTLIVNLPGSTKAVRECFQAIANVIPHAVDLISDKKVQVAQTHDHMQDHKVHHCDNHHHSDSLVSKIS